MAAGSQHTTREKKKPKIKLVNTSEVEFAGRESPGSMYDEIFDAMNRMKPGQTLVVPIPPGVESRQFQNRLNAAQRRYEINVPKGCEFVKRTLADGNLGIVLRTIKDD